MTEDETAAELSEQPAPAAQAAAEADPDASAGSGPKERRRRPRWPLAVAAGVFLLAGLTVVFWFVTLPYYALWPGPVEEVSDLVKVEGGPAVYELNGGIYLLTVSLQEVNAFALAQGWLDPEVDLVARKAIRPRGHHPRAAPAEQPAHDGQLQGQGHRRRLRLPRLGIRGDRRGGAGGFGGGGLARRRSAGGRGRDRRSGRGRGGGGGGRHRGHPHQPGRRRSAADRTAGRAGDGSGGDAGRAHRRPGPPDDRVRTRHLQPLPGPAPSASR